MAKRELPEAEYLKIRNYLLSMIYHAEHESIMIPSSRELAVQFKVARATATKALNLLLEENYLITKKGIGTFSNPGVLRNYGAPVKIAGILVGHGKNLFQEYSGWFAMGLAGLELTKHDCFLREIRLPGIESPERIEAEIRAQNLDALLHIGNSPLLYPILEKLNREGFPIVTLFDDAKTRNYCFDFERSGYEIGKYLAKEKRRLFYGMFPAPYELFLKGIRQAYREMNCELRIQTFTQLDELREALRRDRPDTLYITGAFDGPILNMLDEFEIDCRSECRLATFRPKILDPRFRGFHHVPPEEKIAAGIANDLLEMMNGKRLKPENRKVPLTIRKIKI